jgi:hypothetical protein
MLRIPPVKCATALPGLPRPVFRQALALME